MGFSYRYYIGSNKCLDLHQYYEHNEHHHLTASGQRMYDFFNCETTPYEYIKDEYINKYDDRGRRYECIWYNTAFSEDSLHTAILTYVVDSFTYVVRPVGIDDLFLDNHTLLIVPNPANETVRVTAADSIATISLYASDGRLAHSQEGSRKEAIINLRGLPKGIYIVQARLRGGGVQTGKIVISD